MQKAGSVAAAFGVDAGFCAGFGNRSGDEVDGSPGGDGAEGDLARTLQNFHARHPGHRRKVVGRGGCVGRWGRWNPVFQQGNARGTVAAGTADADVRAETEAVFFDELHAGNRPQGAQGVGVVEPLQFSGREHMQASGDLVGRGGASGHAEGGHFGFRKGMPKGVHHRIEGISRGESCKSREGEGEQGPHGTKVQAPPRAAQFPVWGIFSPGSSEARGETYLGRPWKFL